MPKQELFKKLGPKPSQGLRLHGENVLDLPRLQNVWVFPCLLKGKAIVSQVGSYRNARRYHHFVVSKVHNPEAFQKAERLQKILTKLKDVSKKGIYREVNASIDENYVKDYADSLRHLLENLELVIQPGHPEGPIASLFPPQCLLSLEEFLQRDASSLRDLNLENKEKADAFLECLQSLQKVVETNKELIRLWQPTVHGAVREANIQRQTLSVYLKTSKTREAQAYKSAIYGGVRQGSLAEKIALACVLGNQTDTPPHPRLITYLAPPLSSGLTLGLVLWGGTHLREHVFTVKPRRRILNQSFGEKRPRKLDVPNLAQELAISVACLGVVQGLFPKVTHAFSTVYLAHQLFQVLKTPQHLELTWQKFLHFLKNVF